MVVVVKNSDADVSRGASNLTSVSSGQIKSGIEAMHRYMLTLKDKSGDYYHAGIKPDNHLDKGGNFDYLFGRDSEIFALERMDRDTEVARSTLKALSALQGSRTDPLNGEQPGKILHEMPSFNKPNIAWLHQGSPVYFSVDSTPLFLVLFADYYSITGDPAFKQNAVRAIEWMLNYGIRDGFLRYDKPSKGMGLLSQSWKDGIGNALEDLASPVAIVEVQGYAYAALSSRTLQSMAAESDPTLAARMKTAAAKLKERFNREFWSEKDQFYYLAIDGDGNKVMKIASNSGHLLYTGIMVREQADAVVKRLFMPDMITKYGIRTHSELEPDFNPFEYQRGSVWPHDNWMIAMGLKKLGYNAEYSRLRDMVLEVWNDFESAPEYVPVGAGSNNRSAIELDDQRLVSPPCNPQLWTVGAILYFLEELGQEAGKAGMRN